MSKKWEKESVDTLWEILNKMSDRDMTKVLCMLYGHYSALNDSDVTSKKEQAIHFFDRVNKYVSEMMVEE